MNKRSQSEVSLSVGDGGIGFDVINSHGPTVIITSRFFGNIDTVTKVFTDRKGLLALAKLFTEAAEKEYSKEYCCPATIRQGSDISDGVCCESRQAVSGDSMTDCDDDFGDDEKNSL